MVSITHQATTALALALLTLAPGRSAAAPHRPGSKRSSGGSRQAAPRALAERASWTDLGCTVDQNARTLSVQLNLGSVTRESCQAACSNYVYAAVQCEWQN